MLKDYRLAPFSGAAPKQAVIFLHGLGDRGNGGLLSIGEYWHAGLPDCEFICPDAPFPFDMAPPNFGGRQWFSLQTRDDAAIKVGVERAAPILDEYITHVLSSRKLTPKQLALVGFSQGTRMALHMAPRRTEQLACVIGYSGFLTAADELKTVTKSKPPILLVHGTEDDVVPYQAMAIAERSLQDAGFAVETLTCPDLGHSLDAEGVAEGLRFLQKNLGG